MSSGSRDDVPVSQPAAFGDHREGEPDAPEERNPRGHDSFSPPQVPVSPQTAAASGGNAARVPPSPPTTPLADAKFLKDEFGIKQRSAASLVADARNAPDDAGKLVEELHGGDDPLAGVPTPREPASDLTADTDEERLKPIVRDQNRRTGGG